MCGIVGMAGTIRPKHEQAFTQLLVVDSLRGPHSVGVVSVDVNGYLLTHKKAMLPHDFVETPAYKKIGYKANRVLIGHNRWATLGAINNINAHPFEHGNIVGVHNGTLTRQYLLPDHKDFEVDSENLIHSINKVGMAETYKLLDGAATLVYYNTKDRSLHFIRNEERPLFYTYSKDRCTIFWASEEWMLRGILGRNGIEHTQIVDTKIHNLYSLPVGEVKYDKPLPKLHIKKLEPCPPIKNAQRTFGFAPQNQSKNKSGNVIPINGGNKKEVMAMLQRDFPVGRTVLFRYSGDKISRKVREAIGYSDINHAVLVKVFLNSSTRDTKNLLNKGEEILLGGKVNGYDDKGNVLVQGNSVKEYEYITQDEETKDFGALAGELTLSEFKALPDRSKECCWCTSPIQFEDGNMLLSDDNCVCAGCADIPDVREYLTESGGVH